MFIGDATANPLMTQIALSAWSAALIQYLKNSKWFPLLQDGSNTLNRIASAFLALCTAVGIHIAWNHGDVPGSYMIAVSGLTLTGVGMGIWHWAVAYTFNEMTYKGAKAASAIGVTVKTTGMASVEVDKPAQEGQLKVDVKDKPKP
jgi:hypothetical protein